MLHARTRHLESVQACRGSGMPQLLQVCLRRLPWYARRLWAQTRLILNLLLTAFGSRGQDHAALHAGFAGCLATPLRPAQLYDCLVTVLGQPAAPPLVTPHHSADIQTQMYLRALVAESV
jgi:hypothetical protein